MNRTRITSRSGSAPPRPRRPDHNGDHPDPRRYRSPSRLRGRAPRDARRLRAELAREASRERLERFGAGRGGCVLDPLEHRHGHSARRGVASGLAGVPEVEGVRHGRPALHLIRIRHRRGDPSRAECRDRVPSAESGWVGSHGARRAVGRGRPASRARRRTRCSLASRAARRARRARAGNGGRRRATRRPRIPSIRAT